MGLKRKKSLWRVDPNTQKIQQVEQHTWRETPEISPEVVYEVSRQLVGLGHLDRRFQVRKKRRIFSRRNLFTETAQPATYILTEQFINKFCKTQYFKGFFFWSKLSHCFVRIKKCFFLRERKQPFRKRNAVSKKVYRKKHDD